MPYYKEQFSEEIRPFSIQNISSGGVLGSVIASAERPLRQTVMTGFRTRPKSEHFEEVLDFQADPYGYFLQDVSKRQFAQNLKDRGYDSSIVHPDHGHALDLADWSLYGQLLTGRSGLRISSTWSYLNHVNSVPVLGTAFNSAGPFVGGIDAPASFPSSDLPAFAQKAYARSAPTYEQFNLARSLAELRQLPRVKLDFLSKSIGEWRFQGDRWIQKGANRLGDDSLNVMFGWAPLVKDIIDLCRALVTITNGMISEPVVEKPTHRTFRGPVNVSTFDMTGTTTRAGYVRPGLVTHPDLIPAGPSQVEADGPSLEWRATKRLTREQWFEASFTKFLPIGFDAKNYLERADVLLNVELTPLTLWNLTPWTWLSDWVVDLSSTIAANQAASDKSLISHYAYAMEKTTASVFLDYHRFASSRYTWDSSQPDAGSIVSTTTWKRRIRANPFGFVPGGPSGLNPFRTAVLAALGLSRL